MNGVQIRKLIDTNNEKILELLKGNEFYFVLNTQIAELLDQNERLKKVCPHKFVNGKCIFCDEEENK